MRTLGRSSPPVDCGYPTSAGSTATPNSVAIAAMRLSRAQRLAAASRLAPRSCASTYPIPRPIRRCRSMNASISPGSARGPVEGCAAGRGSRRAARDDPAQAHRSPRDGQAHDPRRAMAQHRVADTKVVDPDRGVDQNHCGSARRRGTVLRSGSVPPSLASRRALSRSIRARNPSRTRALFSVVPVRRCASASRSSSRAKVVRTSTSAGTVNRTDRLQYACLPWSSGSGAGAQGAPVSRARRSHSVHAPRAQRGPRTR